LERRAARGRPEDVALLPAGLAKITAATARMAELINELLDVAQLQAGGLLELQREPTDLAEVVERAAATFEGSPGPDRVRLEEPEGTLVGDWDPIRIERVVENLLANALKYSPEDSSVTVGLARERTEDGAAQAVLRVTDHGVGIPADDLPRIFDRFYRGRNVAGRVRGTGVGLAGVRQIVEQHAGTIEVESREGAGSTFTVRLPL
jgi:signal transduction histidine kinase